MKERIFPLILSNINQNFSFQNCKFDITGDKDNTGRVAMKNLFGIVNSYTLEASICGPDSGNCKD